MVGAARDTIVEANAETIEKVCGARPATCPWNVFKQPIVRDVTDLRAAVKARAVPTKRYLPRRLLRALTFYERALNAAQVDRIERDRARREAERHRHKD